MIQQFQYADKITWITNIHCIGNSCHCFFCLIIFRFENILVTTSFALHAAMKCCTGMPEK